MQQSYHLCIGDAQSFERAGYGDLIADHSQFHRWYQGGMSTAGDYFNATAVPNGFTFWTPVTPTRERPIRRLGA